MTIDEIEAERTRQGRSILSLTKAAGVAYSLYWYYRKGRVRMGPGTADRLSRALKNPSYRRVRAARDDRMVAATYRGFLSAYAQAVGADPEAVLASDPQLRANGDPAWGEAARLRALAVYSTSIEFDLRGARLAAAIGLTRQAVSQILRRVEGMRDDPDIDALIERAGRMLSGRQE